MQDHSTFKQRYFEYLGYYKPPQGPIFLLVGGESEQIGIGKSYYTVSIVFLSIMIRNCITTLLQNFTVG